MTTDPHHMKTWSMLVRLCRVATNIGLAIDASPSDGSPPARVVTRIDEARSQLAAVYVELDARLESLVAAARVPRDESCH